VLAYNFVFNEYFINSDRIIAHSRNFFSDKYYSKRLDVTLGKYRITKLCPKSLKQLVKSKFRFFFDMLGPNEKDMLNIQTVKMFLEASLLGSTTIERILQRVDLNKSNEIDFHTWSQDMSPISEHLWFELEEIASKRACYVKSE